MAAAKSLTSKQVQEAFGVAHMTIRNWRQGTATKEALPCTVADNGRVSFPISKLKPWAKKHGVEFAVDPASLVEEFTGQFSKDKPARAARRTKH